MGRTKLYKVLAIADGRTTANEQKAGDAERKRKSREKVSVTYPNVTDSVPAKVKVNGEAVKTENFSDAAQKQIANVIAGLPSTWETAEESAEARKALYAEPETSKVQVTVLPRSEPETITAKATVLSRPAPTTADPYAAKKALEGVTVELPEPQSIQEPLSADPLAAFKAACDLLLPDMTEDERRQARIYHLETWPAKHKRKMKAAAA